MDKRYQVFISSTFTDLKDERKAIIEGLLNAKYIPSGMEMFAASNDEQFKYIKKIIDICDYYVLIVGARYGSINPSTGKSFTEQEYDYAVEKGIPVLVFLHDDPYNLPVEKRDDDKRELLEHFRNKVSNGRLCKMWHTSSDLISSVIISLGEEVADNPQMGWTRGNIADSSELLVQLNEIRIKNEKLVEENKSLKEEVKKYLFEETNIAFGDDKYEVLGTKTTYTGSAPRKSHSVERKAVLTWNQIFAAIGPSLYTSKTYGSFRFDMSGELNVECKTDFSYIDENCVQTIKIQLETLGLIKVYQGKFLNGGIAECIVNTEKGKKYLAKIKTIKK